MISHLLLTASPVGPDRRQSNFSLVRASYPVTSDGVVDATVALSDERSYLELSEAPTYLEMRRRPGRRAAFPIWAARGRRRN